MEKLAWGANDLLPEGVSAAWGARLIVGQDGYVDLVPDRQDAVGADEPRKALLAKLNAAKPLKNLEALLRDGTVQTRVPGEVTVYEDADIVVRGDSRGSAGYFYIVAYPQPGIVLPRKATDPTGPVWLKLIRLVISAEGSHKLGSDGRHPRIFFLRDVGPGEDGDYREDYSGAQVVFPSDNESIVRVVPKSEYAESVIRQALAELEVAA